MLHTLEERLLFLKKGLAVFWNAFYGFSIRNSQEHIPRLRKGSVFLKKANFFWNAFLVIIA
jgi:hypothetical protein